MWYSIACKHVQQYWTIVDPHLICCVRTSHLPQPKAAAPSPAAAEAPAPSPAPTPAPAAPAAPATAPAAAAPNADHVRQLTEMGFPEDQATAALRAAMGNPDVAVEFLMTGIPDNVQVQTVLREDRREKLSHHCLTLVLLQQFPEPRIVNLVKL